MKILRESKNQKWEEQEEDGIEEVVDSTGGKMGTYQPQAPNNDYGQQRQAPPSGLNLLADDDAPARPPQKPAQQPAPAHSNPFGEEDLLGGSSPAQPPASPHRNIKIPMSTVGLSQQVLQEAVPGVKTKRAGLKVLAAVQKEGPNIVLQLQIENKAQEPVAGFAVNFDANPYKLRPADMAVPVPQVLPAHQLAPGATGTAKVLLDTSGKSNGQSPSMPFKVQVALNSSIEVFVFEIPVSFSVFLLPLQTPCTQADFANLMSRPNQVAAKESFPCSLTEEQVKQKMADNCVYFVSAQANEKAGFSRLDSPDMLSFYSKTVDGMEIGLRLVLTGGACHVNYQCPHPAVVPLYLQALKFIADFN